MRRATTRSASGTKHTADLSALAWLGRDAQGASVLTTAKALLSAEHDLQALLPPALARACRVARLDRQQITLAVPSAAHAAKLRQMAPSIAQALAGHGRNISEVVVRVQAGLPQNGAKTPHQKDVIPLDDTALNAFRDLRARIAPSPLADAIARLLEHHRRT